MPGTTSRTSSERMTLTSKQQHFCRCLASGMSQAQAYRESYTLREGSLNKTHQEAASRLMRLSKVVARVKALIAQRDRQVTAKAVTDREKVLDKLRLWTDGLVPARDSDGNITKDSEGNIIVTGESGTQGQLKAAELLGRTVGMFKDVIERADDKSAAEIAAEIEEMLATAQQVRDKEAEAKDEAKDAVQLDYDSDSAEPDRTTH